MKSYSTFLTELATKTPAKGEVVYNKKMNGIPVKIVKDAKGKTPFMVFVDGDRLDSFKSQSEAEKAAKTVIKELT